MQQLASLSAQRLAAAVDGRIVILELAADSVTILSSTDLAQDKPGHVQISVLASGCEGRVLVSASTDKLVRVWDVDGATGAATLRNTRQSRKRVATLTIVRESELLVGDLSGDVYRFGLDADEHEPAEHDDEDDTSILGHVSMLTDVAYYEHSPDASKSLILTSDRDAHIRASFYSHPYVIHGYYLGHEYHFVSRLALSPWGDRATLYSAGGDGVLLAWDIVSCRETARVTLPDELKQPNGLFRPVSHFVPLPEAERLLLAFEGSSMLLLNPGLGIEGTLKADGQVLDVAVMKDRIAIAQQAVRSDAPEPVSPLIVFDKALQRCPVAVPAGLEGAVPLPHDHLEALLRKRPQGE